MLQAKYDAKQVELEVKRLTREAKARAKAKKAEMKAEMKAEKKAEKKAARDAAHEMVRRLADTEQLTLVRTSRGATGYKGVTARGGHYRAMICENGKKNHLGIFATDHEAALHYARSLGPERSAVAAAAAATAATWVLMAEAAAAARGEFEPFKLPDESMATAPHSGRRSKAQRTE